MIYFSDFDSATLGDVTIAVQDMVTGTTTGDVDYTTAALGGQTPEAALVVMSRQLVADEPSESVGAQTGVGLLYTGAAVHTAYAFSEDGQTSTDNKSVQYFSGSLIRLYNSGGTNYNASGTPTLITDGIRVNWTTATNSHRISYAAFAGADVESGGAVVNLGTGTSALSQSLSFQPDVVIATGIGLNADNAVKDEFAFTFGIATSDGTQRCVIMNEADALADSAPLQVLLTTRIGGQINTGTGDYDYLVSAGNFSGSGFDLTPSASAASDRLLYMALKFTGRSVKLVDFTTPTSIGSQAITGAGFTPQFALVVLTNLESVDASTPHATSDNMSGLSISLIGDEQWSSSIRLDSGAASSDTGGRVANTALLGASATSVSAIAATLTSFDSDGMTLNYSAVQGTGKKGFILFIE